MSSQARVAGTAIRCGKPEISHLYIYVFDLGFFGPEGRAFCGLGFDSSYRKIHSIHPDSPTVKQLVLGSRLNCQNVIRTRRRVLLPCQSKSVVLIVEGHMGLVLRSKCLLLTLQQLVEYPL